MQMRTILLVLLIACHDAEPSPNSSLDDIIDTTTRLIEQNRLSIAELEKTLKRVADRADAVRKMIDCTNAAIDSSMNDRDQILTITECVREAGYRR